jgi:sterol desaturase/sphingolipid hydroxylase (fatty acid hydroxylase superfamily)
MLGEQFLTRGLAFLLGLFACSLVEYLVHRGMHHGKMLGRRHAEHHRHGWGQGWLGEFRDYFLGGAPLWLGGLAIAYFVFDSLPAGIGFVVGCLAYACLAAYAHQVQHDKPELVFWLKRPVHHLHHKHHMWHHNFGILVDVWDRVFGTYKVVEWKPERRPFQHPPRAFFQIKWY